MPKLKTLDDLKRVREEAQQSMKIRLDTGTSIIVGMGTCGIAAVFEGFSLPVLPGAFLIRFRLTDRAAPDFFRYYFNSPVGRANILSVARGAPVDDRERVAGGNLLPRQ